MTTALPNVQALGCPRCHTAMYVGAAEGHAVHGCGTCGGVWLDSVVSARVIEVTCEAALGLADNVARSVPARTDEPPQHALHCPVCQASMATTRVATAWLDVDCCAEHGTWYDRGELQRVARTAHLRTQDWRDTPAPAQQSLEPAANSAQAGSDEPEGERDWTDAAVDIGGEMLAEAPAFLIGMFFEALVGSID